MKIVTDICVNSGRVIFGRKWPHGVGMFINGDYQATKSSLKRLHRLVSKMVNNGKCTITLFNDGYKVDM